MNILLISSSPRKENSRTLRLAMEVLKGCSAENADHYTLELVDYNIGFCTVP